jgi:nitroreductase
VDRDAVTDYPINELVAKRFSPYVFDPEREVAAKDMDSLFEAARWTMSCFNEQPWRYICGVKGDGSDRWQQVHSCLVEGNQAWTANAPVLVLGLVKTTFDRNGKDNSSAEHDLGAASAFMTVEAASRGLHVHQMAGIEVDKIIETFALPGDIKPMTALAIGYRGQSEQAPEGMWERDQNPRVRRPQADFLIG